MIVSLIAAVSENHVIGKDRGMPWHIPADLSYFFKITKGHHVIMGRRTFHEFGVSKPLPDRINLIVSRNRDLKIEGTILMNSIEQALDYAKDREETEVFVIGGGNIYKQAISLADRLYITRVHAVIEDGDTFFPEIDPQIWTLESSNKRNKDSKNPYDLSFLIYNRCNS